jgi:hypothetical protein
MNTTTYRSVKDIAADVRKELKATLPAWTFSVIVHHHTSITLALMSGPEEVTENGNDYVQLNQYQLLDKTNVKRTTNGTVLSFNGWQLMQIATRILAAEHWDKSDSMTDYFCCNFYMNVQIGKWDKPYQVKGA